MAEFQVTNTNDSGAGSLRQAIADANGAAGVDTITFDPSVFNDPSDVIVLTGAEIQITEELIVRGNGATSTTIDGNGNSRVFFVSSVPATIENVTIRGEAPQGKVVELEVLATAPI
ncbi:MAG: hypothetical protein ACFCA4_13150 [Cyanophyceae cyanobacterium]